MRQKWWSAVFFFYDRRRHFFFYFWSLKILGGVVICYTVNHACLLLYCNESSTYIGTTINLRGGEWSKWVYSFFCDNNDVWGFLEIQSNFFQCGFYSFFYIFSVFFFPSESIRRVNYYKIHQLRNVNQLWKYMEIRESFYGWKNESRSKIKISNYRFPSLFLNHLISLFVISLKRIKKKREISDRFYIFKGLGTI